MEKNSKIAMNRSISTDSLNSNFSETSEKSSDSDRKVYYLYNASNVYIEQDVINNILKSHNINQTVNDSRIWQKAFVHKSYSKNTKRKKNEKYIDYNSDENELLEDIIPLQEESNETLEWLGDGILQSIVAVYLFKRFPGQDEGFLTKMRSKLVKTESLAKLSSYLGLENYIMMSQHVEVNCNGRKNSFGYDLCSKFIISVIENAIDITELILHDDNYKDQLMRYCQKMFSGYFPKYINEPIQHVENNNGTITKRFKMNVIDHNDTIIGTGIARSKKEAEQKAAKDALNRYGLINGF